MHAGFRAYGDLGQYTKEILGWRDTLFGVSGRFKYY